MEAAKSEAKGAEKAPRMISLPDRLFADFKVVNDENEKLFEFVAYQMMI